MRDMVRALGIGRIVVGVALVLKPEEAVRGWIGRRAAAMGGTQAVTQAFGARDMVLGAGTLAGLRSGDARDWVAAGACSDVVDLVATLRADDIPAFGRVLVVLMAGGAIAVSAAHLAGAGGR